MEAVDERIKALEATARKYYKDDGSNQWPHIQRVKEQAEMLAAYRGTPLTLPEVAAIYFHDIGKEEAGMLDHGEWAARIAEPLLKKQLTPTHLKIALEAIKSHNLDQPSPTPEADLLRSADADRPNLAWFARKSYNKMRARGYTHQEAIDNVVRVARKHVATAGQLKHRPKLYTEAFKDQIKIAEQQADKLKASQVQKLIDDYNKTHPEESVYT